ncbi:MAG TPA: HtaA domain-containing protein [Enteractinococcus helveticum]|uniref:HtaA domain-containing protein n=1 Tax=Enteractinococcus helveticum TaxID=1837282 RepID=A0A921FQD4_9MICC|nr:HtaA domain-containing protein [Enteractinococcus helveticum]HJF15212.1 HtaA domain-containing protein [Enteractinococcus helveticum]
MHKSSLPPAPQVPLSCTQPEKSRDGRVTIATRATALMGAIALSTAGLAGVSVPAHAATDAGVAATIASTMVQTDASESGQREISQSEISWGIRSSFRNYIKGPIANGSITAVGGTGADSAGIVTWSDGAGSLKEADSLSGRVSFTGGVSYRGHAGDQYEDGYGLNVDLTNPTIEFEETAAGVTGVLYIDAFANPYGAATGIDKKQVAFANLTFSDDFAVEGDTLSGTAAVTLHEDGVDAFIGFYEAGSELDPITFSATLAPEITEVSPEAPAQNGGTVTIPEVEGIEYVVDGEVVSPGDLDLESGVPIKVTARAEEGYALTEGATSEWTFEYEAPVVAEALLTVTPSSELDPNGQTVTIHGSGFDTSADAPAYLPVNKAGFYVQIGWIDENWRPSEGAPSSARSNAYSVWVQDTNGDDPYMLWEEAEDGTASFTWEIEIDKATLDEKQREGAQLAVFTTPAGGTQQPMNETMIPISFADEAELPDPDDSESPEPGDTESPEPGESETPEPSETETPEPSESETPEPGDTESPEPGENESPEAGDTESPEPGETESPSADAVGHNVDDLTKNNRGDIDVPTSAQAGDTITVNVGEQYAGEQVDPVLFSDPYVFDTATVADDGSIQVTLPNNVTGEHRFAVYFAGETGADGVLGWSTITISAADNEGQEANDGDDTGDDSEKTTTVGSNDNEADKAGGLAKTGAEAVVLAIGGLLLLAAGGGVLFASRARRNGMQQ